MDVENQIIEVKINNFNEKHFSELGYNVKNGDSIKIRAKELPSGSGLKVEVECSYCKKIFKKAWRRYLETKDDICCEDCKKYKMMKKSLNKYGNVCSLCNPEVSRKRRKTNIEKYGVEFPLQNKDIQNMCKKTRKKNNKDVVVGVSKTQKRLCEIYNGILNKKIGHFYVDIFLPENKIAVEYDGSGHNLIVILGKMSQEIFNFKKKQRERFLLSQKIKIIRIKYMDKYDTLPEESYLLDILSEAKYFFNKGYSIYRIDLKSQTKSIE